MSVTFSMSHEFTTVERYTGALESDADFDAYDAYLESKCRIDGEFNVANGNAYYILQEILNMGGAEVECYGSLPTTTVLMRVSLFLRAEAGVVKASESQAVRMDENGVGLGCKVIDCGRTLGQIESYVSRLKKLAEIAAERGAPEIQWG